MPIDISLKFTAFFQGKVITLKMVAVFSYKTVYSSLFLE